MLLIFLLNGYIFFFQTDFLRINHLIGRTHTFIYVDLTNLMIIIIYIYIYIVFLDNHKSVVDKIKKGSRNELCFEERKTSQNPLK
jgi:hypothetical protein